MLIRNFILQKNPKKQQTKTQQINKQKSSKPVKTSINS